jgi:archaellum component FlaC
MSSWIDPQSELKISVSVRMMNRNLRGLDWRSIVLIGLLSGGSVGVTSCSKAPGEEPPVSMNEAAKSSPAADTMEAPTANAAKSESKADSKPSEGKQGKVVGKSVVPMPQRPQLIKTAELSLRLESIDKAVGQVRRIVQSKQGDIYDFQDDRSGEKANHREAKLVLKVPSPALDETLAEISKLGRVESQGVKSEDVSKQLVDTDARLKNLRQQEGLTQKIMDRSGSVRDILTVSEQLTEIRGQIEQLDATAKNLRQQVAYSTINLKVAEIRSGDMSNDGIGVQVGETWKNSTHAAGSLATNLALMLLSLVPFTPFIAIGAGGVYYVMRRRRQLPVVERPRNEE